MHLLEAIKNAASNVEAILTVGLILAGLVIVGWALFKSLCEARRGKKHCWIL